MKGLAVGFKVGVVGALVEGDDLLQGGDGVFVADGLLVVTGQVVEEDAEGDEGVAVVSNLTGLGDGLFLNCDGLGDVSRLGGSPGLSGELAEGIRGERSTLQRIRSPFSILPGELD